MTDDSYDNQVNATIPMGTLESVTIRKKSRNRNKRERERDLTLIAHMYVRGKPRPMILEAVNSNYPPDKLLSTGTISRDLEEIRHRWIKSSLIDFNEAKARELAKWDALEAAYWDAWENSLKDAEIHTIEQSTSQMPMDGDVFDLHGSKDKLVRTGKEGNPAFLQGIERCLNARSRILGLFSAEQFNVDWREEARAFGWSRDTADGVKDQVVGILMQSITKSKGTMALKESDIFDAKFNE